MNHLRRAKLALLATFLFACGSHDGGSGDTATSAIAPGSLPPHHPPSAGALDEIPVPADAVLPVLPGDGNVVVTGETELQVTDSGAATYAIPITVPPGRAGVEPRLSLAYSSGGGNGIAGVGWTLTGAPRITRCAKDWQHDHETDPIDFGENAAVFCLNGERLVPIDAKGVADGAEFRLSHDDFSRIVLHGHDAMGPTSFERRTKDGRIELYGTAANSLAQGTAQRTGINAGQPDFQNFPARYAWGISKVSDRAGNFMQYDYARDENGPEPLLTAIEYTGALSDPTLTRKVAFTYENRAFPNTTTPGDYEQYYVGGLPFAHVWRLRTIETYAPAPGAPATTSALARIYVLSYGASPMTSRSRLVSVKECDSDPRPGAVLTPSNRVPLCREADFEYENGDATFTRVRSALGADVQTIPAAITGLPSRMQVGDFDGDGKDDLLFTKASDPRHYWYAHSNGKDFDPPVDTGIGAQASTGARILDFDGDGRADILTYAAVNGANTGAVGNNVFKSNGSGGFFVTDDLSKWDVAEAIDMNGDRLPDLVLSPLTADPTGLRPWWVAFNWGGQTAAPFQLMPTGVPFMMKTGHRVVDIDGDGAAEILTPLGPYQNFLSSLHIYGAPGTGGNNGIAQVTTQLAANAGYTFIDVNGDGLVDVLTNTTSPSYSVQRMMNGGAGFFQKDIVNNLPGEYSVSAKRVADVNLDGRSDFVMRMPLADGSAVIKAVPFGAQGQLPVITVASTIASQPTQVEAFETLDINGDGLDDFVAMDGGVVQLFIRNGKKPDMLTHAHGTLGREAMVTYAPITSTALTSDCAYPIRCVNSKLWVVAQHQIDNGNRGSFRTFSHVFSGGRADMRGAGFLGFTKHEIVDATTATQIDRYFTFSPQAAFYPLSTGPTSVVTSTLIGGGSRLRLVNTTYARHDSDAGPASFFTYASSIDTVEKEVGAAVVILSHKTTTQSVDAYGNVTDRTDAWPDAKVTDVTHTDYWIRAADWLIQSPFLVTETSTDASGASATRKTGYDYDANGLLLHEVIEPGAYGAGGFTPLPQPQPDGVVTLVTTYARNTDGLVEKVTSTDGTSTRWKAVTYDSAERTFAVATTNSVGHTTQVAIVPSLGVPAVSVDENGLYTRRQFDAFGRLRTETPPYGNKTTVSYATSTLVLPHTQVTKTVAGGPTTVTELDTLGRVARVDNTYRQDGKVVYEIKAYDAAGRLASEIRPSFTLPCSNGTCYLLPMTTYAYDNLGRVTLQTNPDGSTIKHQYGGLVTYTWSTSGTESYAVSDALGRIVKSAQMQTAVGSKGAHDVPIAFAYGPFGVVKSVTDGAGNAVLGVFDRRGRAIATKDPDAGVRKTGYDAFGETVDVRAGGAWNNGAPTGGEETIFKYDGIGRMIERDSVDGVATWTYDTALRGKNRLASMTSAQGVVTTYKYDIKSRVYQTTTTVGGQSFVVGQSYDVFGRPNVVTYPAVPGRAGFELETLYSSGGQIVGVKDDVSGTQYWTLKDSDPTETFDTGTYGNGVVRAVTGNSYGVLQSIAVTNASGAALQSFTYGVDGHNRVRDRTDTVGGVKEHFDYDGLNRMIRWKWSRGSDARSVFYDYDDLGNIQHKTMESGPGTSVTYGYDPTKYGPHAVASDDRGAFGYDAQGRQTSAPGRTVRYAAFDLPTSITQGATTYAFTYDGADTRVERAANNGDAIFSIGGVYEMRKTGATNVHVFHVSAGGKPIADVRTTESGGVVSAQDVVYLHGDHLGTITLTTNGAGGVVDTLAYEPFGERVLATDSSVTAASTPHGVRIGFTAQTEDDELSLVDMMGRIYDPVIGRFLSADPHVTNPHDSQSYDRYAYVRNNPVNQYDPTGFDDDAPDMGVTIESDNDKVVAHGADGNDACLAGSCTGQQGVAPASGDAGSDDQGTRSTEKKKELPHEGATKNEKQASGGKEHKAVGAESAEESYKKLLENVDRYSNSGRSVDALFKYSEAWFEQLKHLQEAGKMGASGAALLKMEERLAKTSKAFGILGTALGAFVAYEQYILEHPHDRAGAVFHAAVTTSVDYFGGLAIVWVGAEAGGLWGGVAGAGLWAVDGITSAITGHPTVSGRVAEKLEKAMEDNSHRPPHTPRNNHDYWPP